MTEILTESFCERCGTRYTFEAVEGKRSPLGAIGTLSRGLRHFVSDPGSSLDEAMAVARSEKEQRSTSHALEAFHRTFNFCLNCRQYTCGDCWNAVEGRCLTCAPTADAAPPETRRDTMVRVAPVELAQEPARILIDPMASGAATNGSPPDVPAGHKLPAELEPIDLAVARAEARAEAEAQPEEDASAKRTAEEAAAEEWARISAEALAAEEAATRAADATQEQLDAEAQAAAAAVAAEEARIAAEALAAEQAREAEAARAVEEARLAEIARFAEEARIAEESRLAEEARIADEARLAEEARAAAAAQAAADAQARAEAQAAAEAAAAEAARAAQEARVAAEAQAAAAAQAAAEAAAAAEAEAAAKAAAEAQAAADAQAAAEAQAEAKVSRGTGLGFAPGRNLDDEIAAYEASLTSAASGKPLEAVLEPESVTIEPEPAPDPEPVAAAPEPEPVAAAPESEPTIAAAPAPVESPTVSVESPTAPVIDFPAERGPAEQERVAASSTGPAPGIEPIPTAVGQPLPASVVDGALAWPDADVAAAPFEPAWPDAAAPQRRTGANLPAVTQPAEPLAAHACPSCGLSLSASARFCRRCGTPQQTSAAR